MILQAALLGSYLFILEHQGGRDLNLVDEPWPCDHIVSNGWMILVIIFAVEDRSLSPWFGLGMIVRWSDRQTFPLVPFIVFLKWKCLLKKITT